MIGVVFNLDTLYNVFRVQQLNQFIEPSSYMSANYVGSINNSIATTFSLHMISSFANKFNITTDNIYSNMFKVMYYGDIIFGSNQQFDRY